MASQIEISDESDHEQHEYFDRRAILEPVITRVIDALGGYENGEYRLGDEVSGCLRDLKKLWRKDDTDDERTVARIFWESRVLINDLVPILLATAGNGMFEDKRAIACADIMTAMTWPIDLAEELKELDDEFDRGTDYTQLQQSHLHYKAALLKPGVMQALFGVMLVPLAKSPKERTERDGQVINVVLHLIRNLAFVKDLPSNSHLSADQAELSSLQTKLVKVLSESHIFRLLLTVAANTNNDSLFNGWNTLVLEIFYLLFRGIKPSSLAVTSIEKAPAERLQRLLAVENKMRQDVARKANSRHSRFGTTIAVTLNPNKKRTEENNDSNSESARTKPAPSLVLHRQQAIGQDSGDILDLSKRQKTKKVNTTDELTREDNFSVDARNTLRQLAIDFLNGCFNTFLSALLKDIRSERPKITEKDNLRLLYVTKWFLDFFLTMRAKQTSEEQWGFDLIGEVTERSWIIWVLKRMREAMDEKPKLWTELQAGIECLTQLLLLIDSMSSSDINDDKLREAAEILQQQLIYNGEVLDIAFESLRSYKEGTQSLVYLNSSVHLAYALLRMLERWANGKGNNTFVRKKTKKQRKSKGNDEEEAASEAEMSEKENIQTEAIFSFEAFEMKFAHADITHTLLTYLARYKEYSTSEDMRRVVNLMHRQVVKSKAEGLYFQVSILDLFKSLLADQKSFPRDQPYKDLVKLINYILRQFFKALQEDSFLAIEAFFPKNRGHWKQYSSWEPPPKEKRERAALDTRFPQDVQVKRGHSWSDQLGIAIAALVEAGKPDLVDWTKEILSAAISERTRIIEETDRSGNVDQDAFSDDDTEGAVRNRSQPSQEALSKIKDYLIPYTGDHGDEHAEAATKNPQLKLLFRLSKFFVLDEDAEEFEWYIPAAVLVSDLQGTLKVVEQFLESPIDLGGRKASQLLSKKTRRRRRRRSPSPDSDLAELSEEESRKRRKKKHTKKQKEQEKYKSAQFIEDSDDEYAEGSASWQAFLEREELQRQRASSKTGGGGIGTMRATGTKKRRRRANGDKGSKKRKLARSDKATSDTEDNSSQVSESDAEASEQSPKDPATRPRPKPRA